MKFYNYYLKLIMYSYVTFLGYLNGFSHDYDYVIMITAT
jgi:hypothetical protein